MTALGETFSGLPPKIHRDFGLATRHYHLFKVGPLSVPYLALAGSGAPHVDEFRVDQIETRILEKSYVLPPELAALQPAAIAAHQSQYRQGHSAAGEAMANADKCRLRRLERLGATEDRRQVRLLVEMQRLKYFDYIAANEFLDTSLERGTIRTRFTTQFQPRPGARIDLEELPLSNIAGVGVLFLTADDKLVLSKRTAAVAVYPHMVGYTASGTCDWSDFAPPTGREGLFRAARREAFEELGHDVRLEDLTLFAAGIDVEQFYFQFSFVHHTPLGVEELAQRHATAPDRAEQSLFWVDLRRPDDAVRMLCFKDIEPAAEAAIMTLLMKRCGADRVIELIERHHGGAQPDRTTVRRDLREHLGEAGANPRGMHRS